MTVFPYVLYQRQQVRLEGHFCVDAKKCQSKLALPLLVHGHGAGRARDGGFEDFNMDRLRTLKELYNPVAMHHERQVGGALYMYTHTPCIESMTAFRCMRDLYALCRV